MRYFWGISVCFVLCVACAGADKNNRVALDSARPKADSVQGKGTDDKAKEKLKLVLDCYWDDYNFCDTTANNVAAGEQRFSNFLMLLHYADSLDVYGAVKKFVNASYVTFESRNRYASMIKHYLDNPESPMRDDCVYVYFLRCQLDCLSPEDVAVRKYLEFKLRAVSKNLVGCIATDFKYVDRQGNVSALHAIESQYTLIVFSDPECDNCKRIIPELMADPVLQNEKLRVLMVYPDENTSAWKLQNRNVPEGWIDAYSPDGEIIGSMLYYIPAMPSLYLLDSEKRVVLKDAHQNVVRSMLKREL